MEGPDWKCWPIGKWVMVLSITAIVLAILTLGTFTWMLDEGEFGGYGGGLTLLVAIAALVNMFAVRNACFYKVLWIVELIVAIINSLLMILVLIYILLWFRWCGTWYYRSCAYYFVALTIWLLFVIPYIIIQWIFTYILFRAEKCQQGCEGQQFP
ncbi:hypothetical protein AAVH_33941 [Aphelenchoides avenae]|nr:hypothetical protein AAVH_33941 [Aphelenchus avenae]